MSAEDGEISLLNMQYSDLTLKGDASGWHLSCQSKKAVEEGNLADDVANRHVSDQDGNHGVEGNCASSFEEDASCSHVSVQNGHFGEEGSSAEEPACTPSDGHSGGEDFCGHASKIVKKYDAKALERLRDTIPPEVERRRWEEILQQVGDVLLEVKQLVFQDAVDSKQMKKCGQGKKIGNNSVETHDLGGEDSSGFPGHDAVYLSGVTTHSQRDRGGKRRKKRQDKQNAAACGFKEEGTIEYIEGFPEDLEHQELIPVAFDEACVGGNTIIVDDDSDDDDEPDGLLRPAFVVEGEPHFESGPPQDGMEFLRRVRWEAMHYPKVKVAKVRRPANEVEQSQYMPELPAVPPCPPELLPHPEWESQLLSSFSELRLWLSDADFCSPQGYPGLPSSTVPLPKLTDVPGWHLFCFGRRGGARANAGSEGQESGSPEAGERVDDKGGEIGEEAVEPEELEVDEVVDNRKARESGVEEERGSSEREEDGQVLERELVDSLLVEEVHGEGDIGEEADGVGDICLVKSRQPLEVQGTFGSSQAGENVADVGGEGQKEEVMEADVCGKSGEGDGNGGLRTIGDAVELVEGGVVDGDVNGAGGEEEENVEAAQKDVCGESREGDGNGGLHVIGEAVKSREGDGNGGLHVIGEAVELIEGGVMDAADVCGAGVKEEEGEGDQAAACAEAAGVEGWEGAYEGQGHYHVWRIADGRENWIPDTCLVDSFEGVLWHGIEMCRAWERGGEGVPPGEGDVPATGSLEGEDGGTQLVNARQEGVERHGAGVDGKVDVVAVAPGISEAGEVGAGLEGEERERGVVAVGEAAVGEGNVGEVGEREVGIGSGEGKTAKKDAELGEVEEAMGVVEGGEGGGCLGGAGEGLWNGELVEGVAEGCGENEGKDGSPGAEEGVVRECGESAVVEEEVASGDGGGVVAAGESLGGGEEERKRTHESMGPLMGVVLRLDECSRAALVRRHASWLQGVSHLSRERARWIYALAAVVDKPLDADTAAAFRAIWRRCSVLRARKDIHAPLDEELHMLHTLVAVAGKYFGQAEDG